jgi:hypothetical protein
VRPYTNEGSARMLKAIEKIDGVLQTRRVRTWQEAK